MKLKSPSLLSDRRFSRPLRRVYPVPRWERASARNWFELVHPHPVRVRHASQVLVMAQQADDQHADGLVTWMTQRQPESPLGQVAPPSAVVEPVDDDNVRWFGPSAREWAARMGTDDVAGARRAVMAAVREVKNRIFWKKQRKLLKKIINGKMRQISQAEEFHIT